MYGNSADEPTRLAERCLEVIEGTLKSVDRVVACLRAAELEHGIGIPAMTRAQIADAAGRIPGLGRSTMKAFVVTGESVRGRRARRLCPTPFISLLALQGADHWLA